MKKTIEKLIKLSFGVSQIGGYEPLSTQFFYLSKKDKAVIIKIEKETINFVKFKNDEIYCYAICGDYSNGKADKPLRKIIGKIIYQMGQELVHTDNFIPEKYRGVKIDSSKERILKVEKERTQSANQLSALIEKFNNTYSNCIPNDDIKDSADRLWKLHEAQAGDTEESCCTNGCKQEKFSDDSTPKHEIKNPMGEFDLETVSNLLDAIDRFGQKIIYSFKSINEEDAMLEGFISKCGQKSTIHSKKPDSKDCTLGLRRFHTEIQTGENRRDSAIVSEEHKRVLEDFMKDLKVNFDLKQETCCPSASKKRKFNLQTFIKNVWAEVFNGGKDAITFRIIGNKTIQFYGYSTELNAKYRHLWMVTINIASLDDESVPFISNVNIYDSNVRIQDIFNPNHNIEEFVFFYRKFKKKCV